MFKKSFSQKTILPIENLPVPNTWATKSLVPNVDALKCTSCMKRCTPQSTHIPVVHTLKNLTCGYRRNKRCIGAETSVALLKGKKCFVMQ